MNCIYTLLAVLVVWMIPVSVVASDLLDGFYDWTSKGGKKVTAQLIHVSEGEAKLKLKSGKLAKLPLLKLSEKDQLLVTKWLEKNPSGYNVPRGRFKWPTLYQGKDGFNIKYLRFDGKRKAHAYETKYFYFYCEEKLSDATLWSCISVFYNIVGVLDSLPLHLEILPRKGDKKYEVLLVAHKESFVRLGGRPNSGGFYDPNRNLTIIPYSSLGIVKERGSYKFGRGRRHYSTLIHELTHHSMFKHWRGLPCWLEEGFADYMASMKFKGTEFNLSNPGRILREKLRNKYRWSEHQAEFWSNGVYQAINLDYMLKVKRSQWNELLSSDLVHGQRQYDTANIMVYFFSQLDGDGSHFIKFMHAQRKDYAEKKINDVNDFKNVEKYLLRGRSVKQLEKEMKRALWKEKFFVTFK